MEAAGIINNFPYLVIRDICDYCNAYTGDKWQRSATATAAKERQEIIRGEEVEILIPLAQNGFQ